MSDTRSNTRGIGAARRWVAARFEAISRAMRRLPRDRDALADLHRQARCRQPTEVMDVVAIQRGTSDPDRVIVITGHLDFARHRRDERHQRRARRQRRWLRRRRGDRGGARAVEAQVSPRRWCSPCSPAKSRACTAARCWPITPRAQGWQVEADLNNDIVGNSARRQTASRDNTHVRVFSEGTKRRETPEQANRRRYNGGEVDSPSRNLARFIDGAGRALPRQFRRAHGLPHRPLRPRRRSGARSWRRAIPPCA